MTPPLVVQAALPEVKEQYQTVMKEINVLQQQDHALQEESLSVRLRVEQMDAAVNEHKNKIKHWQKEVGARLSTAESTLAVTR